MLVTMANGLDHLAVVPGIGGVGIGKQQDQVDLIISNTGVDLLMAALLMGQQQGNRQTGIVSDQTAGSSRCIQIVLGQHALVSGAELNQQFFFLVVSQECDIHCVPSFSNYRKMGVGYPCMRLAMRQQAAAAPLWL